MSGQKEFSGFSIDPVSISLPDEFIQHVLPGVDSLIELKLTLVCIWRMGQMEMTFPYLTLQELLEDPLVQTCLENNEDMRQQVEKILQQAANRGVLLIAKNTDDWIILLNTPKGRTAYEAIQKGLWTAFDKNEIHVGGTQVRPNIYTLYEQNIGPLTPLIADSLRDMEDTYTAEWIEEAFRIAIEMNKRNLKYINAILNRWQEEGRDERRDRRSAQKGERKYTDGKFSDIIEH
jgi:DnaD/phage-associated family protein